MGLWDVFIDEVIGAATAVDTDRFHFLLSSPWEMNPVHRQGTLIG
jgi:malate/lactate dehydrogenase